jgi:tRNA nucleotidyltransferase (CCA-adding enzyme)
MQVITTHVNADFDAFGSMVAAKRLYPDAVVAFPGSQEKSVRDFFMESTLYILSIEKAKDIDLSEVRTLILVDTRQKSRIGRFAELADSETCSIHIYDHHPDSEDDVTGDVEIVREVGATVTILSELLQERNIDVNEEEATVLALAIYEDTGSFCFSSVTPEDLRAAAWLVENGANLNIVSDMMTVELSKEQVELLHQLIEETELINIGGLEVIVATAGVENYITDLAVLVHKYKDMENPDAIFALVRMEGRVYLVARSRVDEIDVGFIASEFGGGGHPTAASATIRDISLYEARDKLTALLEASVRPARKAGNIMTRHVITIRADQVMGDASDALAKYQVTSLPVVNNGEIVGILHRPAVERAVHHGLESGLVTEYMDPEVISVRPSDSIDEVLRIASEARFRLVPVMDGGKLAGVISRSDLLEHMKLSRARDDAHLEDPSAGVKRSRVLRKQMEELLPKRVMELLKAAGEVADRRSEDVYLVGGAVRDLLLRNPNLDIDLVVEGHGIPFARELAGRYPGCRVRSHEKFGTAVLLFDDGFKVDTASARHEFYAGPGALPTVEMSSIKRDLFRRDFTMNSLAVCLNPDCFGQLLDFFGGARDIKEKVIRVHHSLAFVEDPTRILRAMRFSSRFGFSVGKHTVELLKRAMKMQVFDKVEGKRLLNELIHIFDEKSPLSTLALMERYNLFKALHSKLDFDARARELTESTGEVLSWWRYLFTGESIEPWIVYFHALTESQADGDLRDIMQRFSVPGSKREHILAERERSGKAMAAFARGMVRTPAQVVEQLEHFDLETLLFMMAKTSREHTRKSVSEFINDFRYVKPELTGRDLQSMGYEPGPKFGEMLSELRNARLNGIVRTEEDERRFIREQYPSDEHDDS